MAKQEKDDTTHFGYRTVAAGEKADLVRDVFDSVASPDSYKLVVGNKYDCEFDNAALDQTKKAIKEDNEPLRKIPEFMSSAKLGVNIENIFEDVLNHFANRKPSEK